MGDVDHFKEFFLSSTCMDALKHFHNLCDSLDVEYPPKKNEHCTFYSRLKSRLDCIFWKAQSLFTLLDIRYIREEYFVDEESVDVRISKDKSVMIIGAGPCGLRTAIEMTLLGSKTVLVEKRNSFSRNNVLHLWPFNVADLKSLGGKVLYPKLGVGGIEHMAIRRIQLILFKVALLLGVEIHFNTSYVDLMPPSDNNGWRAIVEPEDSPVSSFDFDVIVCADSRKNTLKGFSHGCFRANLAIGVTANFVNHNTSVEAKVQETGGWTSFAAQKMFRDLRKNTGIHLENLVYFKDETHYFVMTAKKESLLEKGVLKQEFSETAKLIDRNNVDNEALKNFIAEAANYVTENKIPNLTICKNQRSEPDVALFDFTAMYMADHSSLFREVDGKKLLAGLVGDSLLEPFWPMGTGCARGFFGAFDLTWMLREWCLRTSKIENYEGNAVEVRLLKEREATYKLLPRTYAENTCKPVENYTINPKTRYPFITMDTVSLKDAEKLYLKNAKGSPKQNDVIEECSTQ